VWPESGCTVYPVIKQWLLPRTPRPVLIRWRRFRNCLASRPVRSYSFQGEDMILRRLLGSHRGGFYVDIGACYPILMSNTYAFYRQGWRGLNVDARPGSMRRFRVLRRRDINVETALGESPGTATFFLSAVDRHTNSLTAAEHHDQSVTVTVSTLADLLSSSLRPDQQIDFMSVDVEGHDLAVLRGGDWSRWRPRFVLVEQLYAHSLEETLTDPVTMYMTSIGYKPIASNGLTCIFQPCEAITGSEGPDSGVSQSVETVASSAQSNVDV